MSKVDRIYGVIFSPIGRERKARHHRVLTTNLLALQSLPTEDEYPPLTRNMFSMTSRDYRTPGLYREIVLHFGLTISDVREVWDVWLDKLESLLARLEWRQARAHLMMESDPVAYEYQWLVPAGGTCAKRESWSFEGGPRELGGGIERVRVFVVEQEARLRSAPEDPQLLFDMVSSLARLRDFEGAWRHFQQLESVDPEKAQSVPREWLEPWADRCLLELDTEERRGDDVGDTPDVGS